MTKSAAPTPKKAPNRAGGVRNTVRKKPIVQVKRNRRRKKPRLKIVPPRHVPKDAWASRPPEALARARARQKTLTRNQVFEIQSESCPKAYTVTCDAEGAWSCTCPDYVFRHGTLQCQYAFYCKHIAVCMDKFL